MGLIPCTLSIPSVYLATQTTEGTAPASKFIPNLLSPSWPSGVAGPHVTSLIGWVCLAEEILFNLISRDGSKRMNFPKIIWSHLVILLQNKYYQKIVSESFLGFLRIALSALIQQLSHYITQACLCLIFRHKQNNLPTVFLFQVFSSIIFLLFPLFFLIFFSIFYRTQVRS